MAQAFIAYSFGFVAPNERVGVYLHGFPSSSFVALDVRAQRSPSVPGAFEPSIEVEMTKRSEHVDGTQARTVWVRNVSVSHGAAPRPVVTISALMEALI
jgi:hypothetical protein